MQHDRRVNKPCRWLLTGIDLCTTDRKSSLVALREALNNLEQLFETIGNAYEEDLKRDGFERFQEPGLTEEEMRETVKKGEEIRRQQREEKKAAANAASNSEAKR